METSVSSGHSRRGLGGTHWSENPDLNDARLFIAKYDMALASLRRLDRRFTEVYRDETAVVFIRTGHEIPPAGLPKASLEIPFLIESQLSH